MGVDRRKFITGLGLTLLFPRAVEAAPLISLSDKKIDLEMKILQEQVDAVIQKEYGNPNYTSAPYFSDDRFKIDKRVIAWAKRNQEAKERWRKISKDKTPEELYKLTLQAYVKYRRTHDVDALKRMGQRFYDKNKDFLRETEEHFKVDRRYLVAILCIETHAVTNFGSYIPFNALASFHFTERKSELTDVHLPAFIMLAESRNESVYDHPSSLAGAITGSQMMPDNARKKFRSIHPERRNKPDFYNEEDCIFSTANYLAEKWDLSHPKAHPEDTNCPLTRALFDYNKDRKYVMANTEVAESIKL